MDSTARDIVDLDAAVRGRAATGSTTRLGYRPDIDGLRAVAVLLVVGFHSFPGWVRGGFVGVDVFFVISGFLITGIIIDELNRDDFSFVRFYARRIRRIFPALIVVLAASFWLGWMLLLPDEMTSLGKNIFGGATFSSNLVLLAEGGYFDIEAVRKPLLHLWSLGIEEQFYILWPVLLFVSFKHGLNLFSLICLLLLTSFVANVASVAHHPAGTFYLPHTRAWELLGGGLLAWAAAYTSRASLTEVERRGDAFLQHAIFARPSALSHGLFLNARAFAGTILVTAAVVGLSANTRFPGWAAVLPNLGAVLILSAEGSAINRYVLGSHPFIFIGKISYPLYLWHWVLFSFAGIALAAPPGRGDRVAIILAGVALAWLTYALVERPLRFGAGRRVKAILLCVAVTAIGGVGFVTVVAKGFDRLPAFLEDLSLIKMDPEKDWRRGKCFLESGDDSSKFADSCIEKNRRPLVFLWGDSVAASLYPGLLNAQKTFDFGLGEFATAGCPPVIGFITHVRPYCKSNNDFVLSLIARNKPEIVLLDSAWEYGNPGIGIDLERIDDTISEIRKVAKSRIIMIGPPINWGAGLPQTTFAFAHDSHALIPERTRLNMKDTHDIERILKAKARDSGIEFISAWDAMCNADGCVSRVGPRAKDLTAFDSYHLTIAGARFLADAIMPRVLGGPGD